VLVFATAAVGRSVAAVVASTLLPKRLRLSDGD